MEERYSRSVGTLSEIEISRLQSFSAVIIGCGGLGGTVLELLGRMGVVQITVIDGDVFAESNLNRQILSTIQTLGMSKVSAAKDRMALLNPNVTVVDKHEWLTGENAEALLRGHDVVIDALDNIDSRFLIQAACEKLSVPLIHGAIGGWYGQVAVVFPGDRLLDRLYAGRASSGIEAQLGNPSFTPALVAAIQASEAIKVLLGKGESLRHQVLRIDLLENDYTVIPMRAGFEV